MNNYCIGHYLDNSFVLDAGKCKFLKCRKTYIARLKNVYENYETFDFYFIQKFINKTKYEIKFRCNERTKGITRR